MDIPEDAANRSEEENTDLHEDIATLPEDTEPELVPYLISFADYNEKMCQLNGGMDKKHIKGALSMLKKIGTELYSARDLYKMSNVIKHVTNTGKGDYSKLFKGLHPDVELQEAYLRGEDGDSGRVFFFTLETDPKILYLVAMRGTHLDTSKS